MNKEQLEKILAEHKLWLDSEHKEGKRADHSGADLSDADLSGANISGADLSGANLCGANISGADLSGANLCYADLRGADLSDADLSDADLSYANLCYANLRDADLRGADLRGAILDMSVLYLMCKSLKMKICDRFATQLLYHLMSAVYYSPEVSDAFRKAITTPELRELAKKFHRKDVDKEFLDAKVFLNPEEKQEVDA